MLAAHTPSWCGVEGLTIYQCIPDAADGVPMVEPGVFRSIGACFLAASGLRTYPRRAWRRRTARSASAPVKRSNGETRARVKQSRSEGGCSCSSPCRARAGIAEVMAYDLNHVRLVEARPISLDGSEQSRRSAGVSRWPRARALPRLAIPPRSPRRLPSAHSSPTDRIRLPAARARGYGASGSYARAARSGPRP